MESFETARLLLRPRRPEDFDACLALDGDPEVVRYVGAPWRNAAEHLAFLRRRLETSYPPGLGYWAVVPRDDRDRFLGWVMLHPCGVAGAEVEIGWRLNRAAWGRGYATEAAAPILAQGFKHAAMKEVVADIHPDNAASMRVAEKIGLRFTGMADYYGEPARRYSITREEFRQRNPAAHRGCRPPRGPAAGH
ncbi:MAG: GNAT family N-acetyltransferase [Kiloniellaceae bacterium]|nr:GNAT family N-acetyltransferase [Kiloniellaceae bacterium]